MDIKINKLPKAEVEISVELSGDEFKNDMDQAAKELSQEVKITGFRPGKVPFDVLEKHIGRDMIVNHALDIAIPRILTKIIKDEKFEVIARPKVEITSKDPVKLRAIAPVFPEIKVDGYQKVKIKAKEVKVTDKDVDEAMENLKKRFVEWKEVLQPIQKGDKAEIDFEGFDEGGAPLEGTQSKNHPLIVGENMMVPGFEDHLLNLKTGEEKDFMLTFPKDYHKQNFQNKKVKFHLKIVKVEQPHYPEVNEEFIKKITGNKESVEDFRKKVEEDLKAFRTSEARKELEQQLLDKFYGATKTEFSDILIDEEVEFMLRDMREDMERRGFSFEQYLSQMKKTEEDIRKELAKEAAKRITLRFGLHKIMEAESIDVTDKEIDEEMSKMAQLKPEEQQEVRVRITNSIRLSRLFDRFIEK